MRGKTVGRLRSAVEQCGYDFDVAMNPASRARIYSDLRAIVWRIYTLELCRTSGQTARAFHRSREAVHYALVKAQTLIGTDRAFTDLYDTVYGHYNNEKANEIQ